MRVFKSKVFARFARGEQIADTALCQAVERAERGLVDAELGSGLIKQRIARTGAGRSGGFRTLLAFRSKVRSVFVYGFAKNERDNISGRELEFWRATAASFLAMTDRHIGNLIDAGDLMEVICDV